MGCAFWLVLTKGYQYKLENQTTVHNNLKKKHKLYTLMRICFCKSNIVFLLDIFIYIWLLVCWCGIVPSLLCYHSLRRPYQAFVLSTLICASGLLLWRNMVCVWDCLVFAIKFPDWIRYSCQGAFHLKSTPKVRRALSLHMPGISRERKAAIILLYCYRFYWKNAAATPTKSQVYAIVLWAKVHRMHPGICAGVLTPC